MFLRKRDDQVGLKGWSSGRSASPRRDHCTPVWTEETVQSVTTPAPKSGSQQRFPPGSTARHNVKGLRDPGSRCCLYLRLTASAFPQQRKSPALFDPMEGRLPFWNMILTRQSLNWVVGSMVATQVSESFEAQTCLTRHWPGAGGGLGATNLATRYGRRHNAPGFRAVNRGDQPQGRYSHSQPRHNCLTRSLCSSSVDLMWV